MKNEQQQFLTPWLEIDSRSGLVFFNLDYSNTKI